MSEKGARRKWGAAEKLRIVLADLPPEPSVYFVHSYHAVPANPDDLLAEADYPDPFAAVVGRENLVATQFHPEKSQKSGLEIYRAFAAL